MVCNLSFFFARLFKGWISIGWTKMILPNAGKPIRREKFKDSLASSFKTCIRVSNQISSSLRWCSCPFLDLYRFNQFPINIKENSRTRVGGRIFISKTISIFLCLEYFPIVESLNRQYMEGFVHKCTPFPVSFSQWETLYYLQTLAADTWIWYQEAV